MAKICMLMHRGWSHYVDQLRDDLWQHHPQIHIVDFDFYSMDVFNRCENTNDVLLAIPGWANCPSASEGHSCRMGTQHPLRHPPFPGADAYGTALSGCGESRQQRTVRLIITQRYILMNKARLPRKSRFSYNNGRKQKAVDTMKPVSYMAIVLCVMLFLTGCSSGAVDEEVNEIRAK